MDFNFLDACLVWYEWILFHFQGSWTELQQIVFDEGIAWELIGSYVKIINSSWIIFWNITVESKKDCPA